LAKPAAFRTTVCIALIVALVVVVLGAYVRLSDAGLSCPDWPGCYGQLLGVPQTADDVTRANQAFPERPVEASKAIKEMVHRYFAGALGLLILALAIMAVRHRRRPHQPVALPLALLLLVILQALLGMWTVTLQLKPLVVMAHLLGGFATLSLLWWLFLSGSGWAHVDAPTECARYRGFALIGTLILICQVALGGWTSANYAAFACPDFPTCQSQWWPPMDFSEGFVLWRGLGLNYEFGVLDNAARTAIHVAHRIGALLTGAYLLTLAAVLIWKVRERGVRVAGGMVALLTILQIVVGISNVLLGWPLSLAAAHNALAALLLLAMLALYYRLVASPVSARSRLDADVDARRSTEDVFV
jgi:heme a synthase